MAEEAGLSVEEVERAENEIAAQRTEAQIVADFRVKQRESFYNELGQYGGISVLLVGIWWFTGHGYFWPMWPLGFFVLGSIEEFFQKMVPNSPSYKRKFRKYRETRLSKDPIPESVRDVLERIEAEKGAAWDKMEAIKQVREETGLGLKEAKTEVEKFQLEIRLGKKS